MRCAKCGAENSEGQESCVDCGQALAKSCPKCGADNPAAKKFCGDCGTPLDPGELSQDATNFGERRHLTVLFCDLVGSTQIAAELDPEQWRDMVAAYHRAAAAAIRRFDGHVAKYLGDGVMAFFGYPQAHDNDGERAAHAGLAIIDALAGLNEKRAGPVLAARVGIHSGGVVVGAGAGSAADVFGDAPNLAARVQEVAAPGTVVVTADTQRLISGLFVVEDRGTPSLKGVARAIQLFRVVRPSGARGRLQAAAAVRRLTRFVGRDHELRVLLDRWRLVIDGDGQVVLIAGEPGIGKSRLVQHFHELIAGAPHTSIETAAAAFFQNTPFYPVAEMLKQAVGWRDSDPVEDLARLESALEQAGLHPGESVPLLAPLLNLPPTTKYPPSTLPPEQQRRRLLAMLVEWMLGLARVQPTVVTIEDLHWADPSTLELIQLLVEQGAQARLLLVYTARPEFRAPWPLRGHHTQIPLNRLSATSVRAMVGELAARHGLSEETIVAVLERTGGVPLFVEELTRAVVESGAAKAAGHEIPATLHDSLMARIDRLGPAKEVIQVGAVIGAEFSHALLQEVCPVAQADLQRSLNALTGAQLLYARGTGAETTYQFKHALIRDAAYEALLKTRRKELHRQVARTITEQFAIYADTHPELLARHWTEAGEIEPAVGAWSKASKAAEARSAFLEARKGYERAIEMLNLLPETRDRDVREMELRLALDLVIGIVKGYGAPEMAESIKRRADLAEKTGDLPQLRNSIIGRGLTAMIAGDLPMAKALADQALEIAVREGIPSALGLAHGLQVQTCHNRGDFPGAEKHFTTGLKYFDVLRQVPGGLVSLLSIASANAWMLGYIDSARERMTRMLAALNPDSAYERVFSDFAVANRRLELREYKLAEESAARALELSQQHHFPFNAGLSRCALGSARAHLDRACEGVELIREGIAALREMGARIALGALTASLAQAQQIQGATAQALESVEQALQINPDDLFGRPAALRLRGELRLEQGQMALAETDFRRSITLAQAMSARLWELQATVSLARLLDQKGRCDEARAMLAHIYHWFTEGLDIADLKEAKALLDALDGRAGETGNELP